MNSYPAIKSRRLITTIKMPTRNTPIHANNFMMLSARPNGIYGTKKGIFFTAIKTIAIAKKDN